LCETCFILNHGYVTCLYVPFYLIGDACTQIVAILLVYVSILACCSALCIFEKHMFAFVALIHALPMLTVKIRQPSHEFTFGVGMTFVSYPLVLTPVV
jgi:hypothetical protein